MVAITPSFGRFHLRATIGMISSPANMHCGIKAVVASSTVVGSV